MESQIIAQGAEAVLIKKGNFLVKDRIKKSYRLEILDEKLRKSRTKRETKLLEKASQFISVPKVLESDNKEKIKMQFIQGDKLSETLDNYNEKKQLAIMEQIGNSVAKLHDSDIIHGDLTTSNMLLVETSSSADSNKKYSLKNSDRLINNKTNILSEASKLWASKDFRVFFIDFGLSFVSKRIEDKAVDLHLLRQALEAKHFKRWEALFHAVLQGYNSKDKTKVLQQLKKVESRGRYKKGS